MRKRAGLREETYKFIEGMLFTYSNYQDWINRRREELNNPYIRKDNNIGGDKSHRISDPTGSQGSKLAMDKQLVSLIDEKKAMDTVLNKVDAETKTIIKMYYFDKPRTKTWDGIAKEVHLSRASCINKRDGVIIAIANHLGKV